MAQMTSRYTASHRDVVKSRNQASGFVNRNKCNINRKTMLAASHEGEHFLSWVTEDFTQVGQQSYTPVTSKESEDSRKLGSNTRQCMGHRTSPGSTYWKLQPTGYQQKQDHKKEDGKLSHWCISRSAGPQCEDHPLTGPTAPSSLTADRTAHTVSSTFCPHYSALRCLFLGASVYMSIS